MVPAAGVMASGDAFVNHEVLFNDTSKFAGGVMIRLPVRFVADTVYVCVAEGDPMYGDAPKSPNDSDAFTEICGAFDTAIHSVK